MMTLIVLAVSLLAIGLLFGKRFGVPVLGLAAGFVIAQSFAATAMAVSAPYLGAYAGYVPATVILLPSLILILFAKGRHRTAIPRVIGAAVYAVAGVIFVLAGPLAPAGITAGLPTALTSQLGLITTGLLVVAVLEVVFGKASKKKLDEPHK